MGGQPSKNSSTNNTDTKDKKGKGKKGKETSSKSETAAEAPGAAGAASPSASPSAAAAATSSSSSSSSSVAVAVAVAASPAPPSLSVSVTRSPSASPSPSRSPLPSPSPAPLSMSDSLAVPGKKSITRSTSMEGKDGQALGVSFAPNTKETSSHSKDKENANRSRSASSSALKNKQAPPIVVSGPTQFISNSASTPEHHGKEKSKAAKTDSSAMMKVGMAMSAPMPNDKELEAQFDALLNDLNVVGEHRENMDALPRDKKWMMILAHRSMQQTASEGGVDNTPEVAAAMFKGGVLDPAVVTATRIELETKPILYTMRFVDAGGMAGIIKWLKAAALATDDNTTPEEHAIQYECVRCLRAVTNISYGLVELLKNPDGFDTLALCLDNMNIRMKALVLKMLAALCLVDDGHRLILDALNFRARARGETFRFKALAQYLDQIDSLEFQVAFMTFLNSLVNFPDEMKVRVHLRNEFLQLGVMKIIASLKSRVDNDLTTQIQIFEEEYYTDLQEMVQQFNSKVNTEDPQEMFKAIKAQIIDSEAYDWFVSTFQHFMLLPYSDQRLCAKYWQLIRNVVAQIVIQDRRGMDYDFQLNYKLDVSTVIQSYIDNDEAEQAKKRVVELEAALTRHDSVVAAKEQELSKHLGLWEEKKKSWEATSKQQEETIKSLSKKVDELQAAVKAAEAATMAAVSKAEEAIRSAATATAAASGAPATPSTPLPKVINPMAAALAAAAVVAASSRTEMTLPDGPPPLDTRAAAAPPPPPPPPMGGPPPPPPPPGGPPGPPPPPGVGFMAPPVIPGLKPKKAITPAVKVKNLQWMKIPNNKVKETVWGELNEEKWFEVFDMKEIEESFAAKVVKQEEPEPAPGPKPKPKDVEILDPKRAYNVSIMLARVPYSFQEIKTIMLEMDESKLNEQMLKSFLTYCPTAEEASILSEYRGDREALSKADRFLWETLSISHYEDRLQSLYFKLRFNDRIAEIAPTVSTITKASRQVLTSSKLKLVFEIILALGNFLNGGTSRGSAYGFKLESLLKLGDTKTAKNRSFLHYLAEMIDKKFPELKDFYEQITSVHQAAASSTSTINSECAELRRGLESIKTNLDALNDDDGTSRDRYVPVMKAFYDAATIDFKKIEAAVAEMEELYDKAATYYGESAKTTPPDVFYAYFKEFLDVYQKCANENNTEKEKQALNEKRTREQEELKNKIQSKKAAKEQEDVKGVMDGLIESLRTGAWRERRRDATKSVTDMAPV